MTIELLPIPARACDLVVRRCLPGGLTFTESRHREPLPRHVHESTTLTILLHGTFEERYGGSHRPSVCEPTSVLVRPGGEVHEDSFGRDGALNFVVEFSAERLALLADGDSVLQRVGDYRTVRLQQVAHELHQELRAGDSASSLALEGLTLEMVALLQRAEGADKAPLRLRQVVDILHDRMGEHDLRIETVAREVGIHPVYLARVFRTHYRQTPGQYLRQVRLQWAANALMTTPRSIVELAQEAGFSDQSHFTRAFRQAFGVPPARYRKG